MLPKILEPLTFGWKFNQPLERGIFPETLKLLIQENFLLIDLGYIHFIDDLLKRLLEDS